MSAANFIRTIILKDVKKEPEVVTRFPPEPNGFLHIGHVKSIWLNFSLASEFKGRCHLRFDDSNPETEDEKYMHAIKEDIAWLGYSYGKHLYYASDYFDQLYQMAIQLIKMGKAFVCDLTYSQIREYRGTLASPGKESPYRNRSVEENLQLFADMAAGKFKEGERVLRAKIDMSSPNINLRDPILYRIKYFSHPRLKDKWSIYPMYDYCHALSDFLENITHSICTLEFEDHRPLYDWCIDTLNQDKKRRPQQIEFARLNLTYTITSKRKLLELVEGGYVEGWDDPRMPTISGMRKRGIPAQALLDFCDRIGVTKKDSCIDINTLENIIRSHLNKSASRVLAVFNPLKVVITNLPPDYREEIDVPFLPGEGQRRRKIIFTSELYIERDDFSLNPPEGFLRLVEGGEVKLRYSYVIRCDQVIKEGEEIKELRCSYFADQEREAAGIIHWVSRENERCKVNLYQRLFNSPYPWEKENFLDDLNKDSFQESSALLEKNWREAQSERLQFERKGYFYRESDHFNMIIDLRKGWK